MIASTNKFKNAVRRFRQGRITYKKLKSLVEKWLAEKTTSALPTIELPTTDIQLEEAKGVEEIIADQ